MIFAKAYLYINAHRHFQNKHTTENFIIFWWRASKLFSCSAHISIKFVMLISFKMTTIVGFAIFMTRTNVLAHQIRISDISSWDRKSYFSHVILPRLSREDCTLVVLELTHMVVK